MTAPTYISNLGSAIKAKEAERKLLQQHIQEFLNQGGKITVIGATTPPTEQSSMSSSSDEYNKRVALQRNQG